MPDTFVSITMAAGGSSRMPEDMRPKSCCKVGPVSIIRNALNIYEQAGIRRHVIVVGQGAERVMEEISSHRPDVLFAYQPRLRGTGDAVRCGLELLESIGAPEHVLISAGDKFIAAHIVRGLVEYYAMSDAGLCMVVGNSGDHRDSGHVVTRDGAALGIIEVPDIKVRQLAAALRSAKPGDRPGTVRGLGEFAARFVKPAKLPKCFPALAALLRAAPDTPVPWEAVRAAAETTPDGFELNGARISTEEAAALPLANLSVYVGQFGLVRDAVKKLRSDNVQGEWYFTDIVGITAAGGGRVELFRAHNPQEVMGFNTVEDLEKIRAVYAAHPTAERTYPSLQRWIGSLERLSGAAVALEAARGLATQVGAERPAIIARSPGRINLMGRHIDHQGGMCNLMAIDREVVIAASPRDDDRVNLWNALGKDYPFRSFTIAALTADIVWEDWMRTLDTQFVQRTVSRAAGDWTNYVMGAALRLQHRFKDRRLRGMDAFVTGNIPPGAGLSSSSALVVAAAEALTELNALNVGIGEFVDLCGEGEWFAGTRGGSADHAAIKFSRRNQVIGVGFFPFRVMGLNPFPEDCRLVVCYSGIPAKKTDSARARFNARVACYHMAREVIKEQYPALAPLIEHLRDVNTQRLDISLPALYSLLRRLPNSMPRAEVERLAHDRPTVAKCIGGLNLAEHEFPLRDAAIFGLAECERAQLTGGLLQRGDAVTLGRMMNLSHDGDRVARWNGEEAPFRFTADDARMDKLICDAASLRPLAATGAALWQQPGSYACSVPEMDLMVDRALQIPGVLGAQISGAGLGGCVMALARKDAAADVLAVLRRDYYEPRGIEPVMFVCQPSAGSQVLTTVEDGL